jgi:hypothetical protein
MRLSKWYDWQDPELPGVYEIVMKGEPWPSYKYWSNGRWGWRGISIEAAYKLREFEGRAPYVWRGLAEKPK